MSRPPLQKYRLPLPISKNDRVRLAHRQGWTLKGGVAVQVRKTTVVNTKEWQKYVNTVFGMVKYEHRIEMLHPADDERVAISCWWYLRSDRADCVNYHDLLADSLKGPLGIDDRWFLLRDMWSSVDLVNPRVEVSFAIEKRE